MSNFRFAACLIACSLALAGAGEAGQSDGTSSSSEPPEIPFVFDGPPAPIPPEVMARDPVSGRTTIRAVRLTTPLRLDGRLDEAVYTNVIPISDFIQMEPKEGAPATEKTEIWLLFDKDFVYVVGRCWESQPERLVANEMRRDNIMVFSGNDHVAFMFDTFYDRRNGVQFTVTPIGGRTDGQFVNETQYNGDWNPIWDVEVGRFEGGWTFEAAVPFKSLRYRPGRGQIWGFNARRRNQWKNEASFLTRVPASRGWQLGNIAASFAATAVGLEAPAGSNNLEIKPYVIGDLTRSLTASQTLANKLNTDAGVDVKYGVTQNLTADFTFHTDFAQVEADEQQVNLTRFSLFFPEKREFFLENQGTFVFGGVRAGSQNGGDSDTPILFYSRRIGLEGTRAVPILAGGRATGRLGGFSLGLLNIQADTDPGTNANGTNFSVVRLKRDLFRRSSVGAMYTRRGSRPGFDTNDAYGVDGAFAFFDNLNVNTYWARTHTDGVSDEDVSYRTQLDYAGDRYGVQVERLVVGDNFSPEVGFVRRHDIRRSFGQLRFSPRPRASKIVRKYSGIGSLAYIENKAGRVEARDWDGEFAIEFQNSDRFSAGYSDTYEFLPQAFLIASGIVVPVGGYTHTGLRTGYNFGQQRRVSANVLAEYGRFYSGHKTALSISRARVNLTPHYSVEPSYSLNVVDLVEGSFSTHLAGVRVTHTPTPRMFTSALLQYSSGGHVMSANVRLRWEYRPGSELFVVLNEQRDTSIGRFPALADRALIVKINRLLRY